MREIACALLLLGLGALPASGQSLCQELPGSNPAPGGQLGCSVNLNNGLLALGAHRDGAGSITPCHRGPDEVWACDPPVRPAGGRIGDEFGRSVAVDEEWLIVGSPFAGASGVVYVYRRVGGAWEQSQKLTASDGVQGDQFGITLARSDDTLIVGAPNHAGNAGSLSGAVYVFRRTGDAWMQQKKLTAGDAAPFDNFGFSLAIDDRTAVVGAPFHDGVAGNSGAAYVFDRATWSQQELPAGDGAADDEFGSAVAVSGNALAVGARADDVNGKRDAGSAYVYERGESGWREDAHFFGEAAGDRFGVAVSLSDGQLAIGAFLHDGTGSESGAAYLFQRWPQSDGTPRWVRTGEPLLGGASGDRFGQAVSTDGSEVLIGAYRALGGAGLAKVCPLVPPVPAVALSLVKSGPASAKPGQTIAYTLTAINHGPGKATGVHLEDPIPAGLQPVSASLPGGCSIAADRIACDLPDLAFQESQTVRLQFDVLETCARVIANQATVSANEEDPVQSSMVSTEVVRVANLVLTKTAPASVKPGDPLPYTLTVVNMGPDIACRVVISDPIPAGLASPGLLSPCRVTGNEIRCAIGELPAGTSYVFPVIFTAPPGTACGITIVNKARVSAVPPAADPQPGNDSETVTTAIAADLSITKTADRATASPGDALTYTIVVSNPGGSRVTVTDVFPAGLTQARWCRDVDALPCVPYLAGHLYDVLTDSTATYRVRGTVAPALTGTLANTASVAGTPGCVDPDPGNNSATAMIGIVPASGVTVLCKGIAGSLAEGGAVTYTFLLLNGGPAAQMDNPGAEFSDLLPPGLTLVSANPSSGAVTLGNPVTWNGAIPVGGMVMITITATIGAGTEGMTFCNAPTVAFDGDGDGTNEASGTVAVPCCFLISTQIPALSGPALATLALLLGIAALRRLRRPIRGR